MSIPLVLITGATGFVGGHVVHEALQAGYPLKLTTRPPKVQNLRTLYNDLVEVVGIADLSTGDYTEALKGVGAIIHIASTLPGKDSNEAIINNAINGTLNILKQAASAGIKKIVVTSSFAALIKPGDPRSFDPSFIVTEEQWNPVRREDNEHIAQFAYSSSKALAERELWKFADAHPEIDITTILPPFIYGPYPPGYKADISPGSGTNALFYENVLPKQRGSKLGPQNPSPRTVDVRDVAKAHILALTAPPSSKVGRKRIIVAGECFTWKDAVEHLYVARPELRDRLPDSSDCPKLSLCKISVNKAREILGFDSYVDWRKTVEDAVDEFIRIEKDSGGSLKL